MVLQYAYVLLLSRVPRVPHSLLLISERRSRTQHQPKASVHSQDSASGPELAATLALGESEAALGAEAGGGWAAGWAVGWAAGWAVGWAAGAAAGWAAGSAAAGGAVDRAAG